MRTDDPELMNHLKQLAIEIEVLTLKSIFKTVENAYSKHDVLMLIAVAIQKALDEKEALQLGETMLANTVTRYYTKNGPVDPDT